MPDGPELEAVDVGGKRNFACMRFCQCFSLYGIEL